LRNVKREIQWWRDRLKGRDLRTLDAAELRLPATEPGFAHKLRAIKCFFTWLRKHRPVPAGEVGFKTTEGPDTTALVLPQAGHKLHFLDAEKAKARREKGMRALLGYFAVREAKQFLGQDKLPYRDALDLLAATLWHTTELVRWLKLGSEIESLPKAYERIGAAKLVTVHKSGKEHRRPISKSVLAVAERLRDWHIQERLTAKGRKFDHVPPFPVRFLIKLVHDACAKLEIKPKFGPGHLRHAAATFSGLVQLEQIALGLPVTALPFTPADLALDGTINDVPKDLEPLDKLRAAIRKRLQAVTVPALPGQSSESVRGQVKAARAATRAQMGHAPNSPLLESTYMDASVQLDLPPEAEII
jgi:integrase